MKASWLTTAGGFWAAGGVWLGASLAPWLQREWGRWRAVRPEIAHLAVFYYAYLIAGGFGQSLNILPNSSITFWPPAGVYVATLLLSEKRTWRWWVAVGCLAELSCNIIWWQSPLWQALLYYSANALEALFAAWLVGGLAAKPFRLATTRDLVVFAVLGACVAPLVGATIIAGVDALIGKQTFAQAWPLVWLGDGAGILVGAPLTLAAIHAWRDRAALKSATGREAVLLFAGLAALAALAFADLAPTAYIAMPLLLWIALRFHLEGAGAALASIAVLGAGFAAMEQGYFADDIAELGEKVFEFQVFLAISAVSTLLVAALSRQNQDAHLAVERAKAELETRVAERTEALRTSRQEIARAAAFDAFRVRLQDVLSRMGSPDDIKLSAARVLGEKLQADRVCYADIEPNGDHAVIPEDYYVRRSAPRFSGSLRLADYGEAVAASINAGKPVVVDNAAAENPAAFAALEVGAVAAYPVMSHGKPAALLLVVHDTARVWSGDDLALLKETADRVWPAVERAQAVNALREAERRQRILVHELSHRVKNTLATVQSIAMQSLTHAVDKKAFEAFQARLTALARGHDLLAREHWEGISLGEIVRRTIAPYQSEDAPRFTVEGPEIWLPPKQALALTLALHELCANALRFGALSDERGGVDIRWIDRGARFGFTWREHGGPRVSPPSKGGFGTRLIERGLQQDLAGEISVRYEETGLVCVVEAPLPKAEAEVAVAVDLMEG
jgi:two-component sensor histidine kinase/integral membrane sensor domain MASE1